MAFIIVLDKYHALESKTLSVKILHRMGFCCNRDFLSLGINTLVKLVMIFTVVVKYST